MADEQEETRPPEIVTELRAVEWELNEIVRRLEVLRNHLRDLQEGQTHGASGEETRGAS